MTNNTYVYLFGQEKSIVIVPEREWKEVKPFV